MKRRNFIQQSILAGAGTLASQAGFSTSKTQAGFAEKTFHLDYAFHDGMFKNNGGNDFVEQIKWAHSMGFRSIEDNGMLKRPVEQQKKIGDTLAALGMRMGVFVVDGGDNWKTSLATGKQEFKETFLKTCRESVEVAKRTNARWMTVVPGFFERNLPLDLQTANVIDILRRGAAIFEPHGLIMVLEPLSDTPDLFLRHSTQTYMICKAVNSPSCKILFDMYHMQRNEGDIINNIDRCWDEIAYLQIGDNPGRKEPTTGEMNYKNIFQHIHQKATRAFWVWNMAMPFLVKKANSN